jgi:hypothetical protein
MEWLHLPLKIKPSKFRATIVDLHKSTLTYANKRDTKTTKSKKKTGQPKQTAFHNGQDDCKDSVALAKTILLEEDSEIGFPGCLCFEVSNGIF